MTTWSTEHDPEVSRRLADQERELARLRAEVAVWRAAASGLPTRTDSDFTSVSGRSVEAVYTPLDQQPPQQGTARHPGAYTMTPRIHPTN